MKITILCTSSGHPVNAFIHDWMARHSADHEICLVRSRVDLLGGDLLFLISCGEIVRAQDRALFSHTFVLHASDLPRGRGWNPHIWAILGGAREVTVTLLEAGDKVDTGAIWAQVTVPVEPHALWYELNEAVFTAEFELMDHVLNGIGEITPRPQASDVTPTYFRLRTPEDSRIDPQKSIAEQFDLLRVCDPDRYPAFFDMHGHRFTLRLERTGPVNDDGTEHQ